MTLTETGEAYLSMKDTQTFQCLEVEKVRFCLLLTSL